MGPSDQPRTGRRRGWRRVGEVARTVLRGAASDRVGGLAAEIAFFGMLSVFPLTIAVAAAVGFLEPLVGAEAAEDVRGNVVAALRTTLPAEADGTVEAVEDLFADTRPGVFTIGLLLAVWSASRGFLATVRALDLVYDLRERRSYVELRLLSLGLALATVPLVALALVAFVVGPLLGGGREVAEVFGASDAFSSAWAWFRWPAAIVVVAALVTTLYHLAPDHRTPWRWDLPGTVVAVLAGGLASVGLRIYLRFGGSSNVLIGSLGSVLVVMIWMYLVAIGLLVGAELNAVLAERAGVEQVPRRNLELPRLEKLTRRWAELEGENPHGADPDGSSDTA
jgi:membrane protein